MSLHTDRVHAWTNGDHGFDSLVPEILHISLEECGDRFRIEVTMEGGGFSTVVNGPLDSAMQALCMIETRWDI